MKFKLTTTKADVRKIQDLLEQIRGLPRYKRRIASQERLRRGASSRADLWRALVTAQLTSAQKSAESSPVALFMGKLPFPLAYNVVKHRVEVTAFVTAALTNHGGIRFANKIGNYLEQTLRQLESGEWAEAFKQCDRLRKRASPDAERRVADYFRNTFKGIGSKQSRNLLQNLGLIKYEIPIDSRTLAWLKRAGFPKIGGKVALQDDKFYEFVLETVQDLCAKAGCFPTEFDAAVFIEADLRAKSASHGAIPR